MSQKTFLILGGYGNTGLALTRLMLQETDVRLVLAGRNREKAEEAAARLNVSFGGNRVTGIATDACSVESLKRAFEGIDFVIVASGTVNHTRKVVAAALAARVDYLDVQYSDEKLEVLQSCEEQIKQAGRCFITEAGFHPGLPSALVRYADTFFDSMDKAVVSSVINLGGLLPQSKSTLYEFVEEFKHMESYFLKDGAWQISNGSMKDMLKTDFGPEFGRRTCAPMTLEEMRALPEIIPTLRETGFYIADTNPVATWVVFPLIMASLKLWPERAVKPLAKLLQWTYKLFKAPPYGVALKVEAHGEKDGKAKDLEIIFTHEDGYLFTAIPVVACLLQYLDGSIQKPGLWVLGHLVEPKRLIQDIERLGAKVRIREEIKFIPEVSLVFSR